MVVAEKSRWGPSRGAAKSRVVENKGVLKLRFHHIPHPSGLTLRLVHLLETPNTAFENNTHKEPADSSKNIVHKVRPWL
jgi:hypothetical protein